MRCEEHMKRKGDGTEALKTEMSRRSETRMTEIKKTG